MDPSAAQAAQVDRLLGSVGVGVPAGQELIVFGGETVRVTATIDYRGPAFSVRLYAAIGNRGLTFDEIWAATASPVNLPESINWVTRTLSVDVVTDAQHPGLFDLYVRILETGAPGMPELANVIRVEGDAGEDYVEVQHTIHPFAYTYQGDAETAVFEFRLTPEQVPGTEWLGDRIVDSFVAELQAQGSRLLELRVSRDTTPTWWRLPPQSSREPPPPSVQSAFPGRPSSSASSPSCSSSPSSGRSGSSTASSSSVSQGWTT